MEKDYISRERQQIEEYTKTGYTNSAALKSKNSVFNWTNTTVSAQGEHITKRRSHKRWIFWLLFFAVIAYSFVLVPPIVEWDKFKIVGQGFRYTFNYGPIYIARTGSVDHWQDIWNTNANSLGTINIWLQGLADSLRFAFIGLFFGMTLAIPTAALASNRVVNSKSINGLTRIFVTLVRAIPIVMLAGIISRFFDDGGEGAVTSIIILSLFVWVLLTLWHTCE